MFKLIGLLGVASLGLALNGSFDARAAAAPFVEPLASSDPRLTLTVSPSPGVIYVNGSLTFTTSGGTAPYTYSVAAGGAGGAITSAGVYTAPATVGSGSATINVTDAASNTASVTVNVIGVTRLSSIGFSQTVCALTNAGNVYCWGWNGDGQLGNNTTTSSSTPVEVDGGAQGPGFLSGIVSIAAGSYSTCALSFSGNVYCWGDNTNGQLGNNTTTSSNIPVEVRGVGGTGYLSGIVSITVGEAHTCASSSSGNIYCWGANGDGELGNNSTTGSNTPVEVSGVGGTGYLSGIVSVAALEFDTCASSSSGNVYCWGINESGQLGVNTHSGPQICSTLACSDTPLEVLGVGGTGNLSGIANIAVGLEHVCASSSSGNVYCWGSNGSGELGNNSTTESDTPVEVLGVGGTGNLSGVVNITAGEWYSCAQLSSGNEYCWGSNSNGQLGNNTTTESNTPVEVVGVGGTGYLSGVVSVTSGQENSCALTSSGYVYCWGSGFEGDLGDNSTSDTSTPVEVWTGTQGDSSGYFTTNTKVSAITPSQIASYAGGLHTCALSTAGNVYCWGANSNGQLGDNTSSGPQTCNSVSCSETPVEVLGVGGSGYLSGMVSLTAGNTHTCALSTVGNVYCWGNNSNGQLGNNTTTQENVPVEVLGVGGSGYLSGIVSIAAGALHTCALSELGNVYCWGEDYYGDLGNNSTTDSHVPVEVVGVGGVGYLSGVASITGGGGSFSHCVVSSSGNVYCWGNNQYGNLGNNTTTQSLVPLEVLGVGGSGYLSGIVSLITGNQENVCALSVAGNVYCWGTNWFGELGINTNSGPQMCGIPCSQTPVEVLGVGGVGNLSRNCDHGRRPGTHLCGLFLRQPLLLGSGWLW